MTLIREIVASFQRLPMAVQVWVALWLAPIHLATLFFLTERNGLAICALAILGMAFNLPIMAKERGMSALMAVPHLLLWSPLVVLTVLTILADIDYGYRLFLLVLLITDVASLVMDARDLEQWRAGNRSVA